jgi:trans-L-3-hydroxyproline dehydratase
MSAPARYRVTDMHTAGEPVRIFTGGIPELQGKSLLDKRRFARDRLDAVRRRLMLEPRGHGAMYGVWPTEPDLPEAALAVLFTHCEGYSTMCGHATIALGRWVLDEGIVAKRAPETRFVLQCPCGPVAVSAEVGDDGRVGRVAFDSVPAFAHLLDAEVAVPGFGRVRVDVSFGGAFYAVLPASRLGLDLRDSPYDDLVRAGQAVTAAGRAQVQIAHPVEPDLGFLYGTILTDDAVPDAPTYNLCIFGGGQVDRSPTGSGATARMALDRACGGIGPGAVRAFHGLSGLPFVAELREETDAGVVVRVAGEAHYSGTAEFVCEPDDPLADGLEIPERLGDLWRSTDL